MYTRNVRRSLTKSNPPMAVDLETSRCDVLAIDQRTPITLITISNQRSHRALTERRNRLLNPALMPAR